MSIEATKTGLDMLHKKNAEIDRLRGALEQMTLMRDMLIAQLQSHGIDPVVHVEPESK
jgi:hypothetical protein